MMPHVRIGTRTSALAMWQATKVSQMLIERGYTTEVIGISSTGDQSLSGDLASTIKPIGNIRQIARATMTKR